MRIILSLILSLSCISAIAKTPVKEPVLENLLIDAVTKIDEEEYSEALSLLQAIAQKDSTIDAIWYYSGLCKYSLGAPKEACGHFEKAVALDSSNLYYKKALASTLLDIGEGRRAAELLVYIKDRNPQIYRNAQQFTMIGEAYLQAGEDSLSKVNYEEALLFNPDYTPAVMGLTEVYRQKGNMPAYFLYLNKIIRDSAVDSGAKTRYLNNLFKYIDSNFFRVWNKQLDTLVCGMVESAPADTSVIRFAGQWFYGTGRKDKGKEYFDSWLRLCPNDFEPRNIKMELAYTDRNYPEFFAQCDTLLSMDITAGQKVSVYGLMGDCLYMNGSEKKAFKAYENALKLNPAYAPVLNNYAYFLSLKKKKLSKAEAMSREAVEQEPDNATYLDTYGWVLFLQGDAAGAKVQFKRAMLFGGKQSRTVLEHYAAVLSALGEKELSAYYQMLSKEKTDED